MEIQTKFQIGDEVWKSDTEHVREQLPCPECEDQEEFEITTPGGTTISVLCPRCQGHTHGVESLMVSRYKPVVRKLTVGSVRYDSNETSHSRDSYMCVETGVGSGNVYYADDLHETEEEAQAHAKLKAKLANEKQEAKPEVKWQRRLAALPLPKALCAHGQMARYDGWKAYHVLAEELRDLIEEVESGVVMRENVIHEVRRQLEVERTYRDWSKDNPLFDVLKLLEDLGSMTYDARVGPRAKHARALYEQLMEPNVE